ncbi:hypothetical protein [Acidisoma cladoniae]|jgi:hypothetical protein|uniref:hypothetical protein n=1 Tax=Acidisoma cladoniae TaxID=3040935 RepID=UPI00254BB2E2|nr:hypothetical protein [Acidisoma sp. PAMC 29798]
MSGCDEQTMRLNDVSLHLIAEASSWIGESPQVQAGDEAVFLQRASDLPERLRSCMMAMSNSKALEMSRDIPTLCSLAAKVALILHGATSAAVTLYENDIYYYRAFPSTKALVLDYERFKSSLGGRRTA